MKAAKLELLVWVLIYAGIGLAIVGLWTLQAQAALAQGLMVVGGSLAAIGVLLIWVRSRMRGDQGP